MQAISWDLIAAYLFDPVLFIIFMIGCMMGSFLNVCILRIPQQTFWQSMRSHCPHCKALIPFWLNIPMISWLLLRGRAKCCKMPISVRYPLIELLTGVISAVIYGHFKFCIWDGQYLSWEPLQMIFFAHAIFFAYIMIVVSVIDYDWQIIPDVISLPMILVTPFWIWVHPTLSWQSSLMGILLGGGVLYTIAWLYYVVRKDYGMGFGDVKLLAGIGGWLGVEAVMPTLFLGSIIGTVLGGGLLLLQGQHHLKAKLPFGPFLAGSAMIYLLQGQNLMEWWLYH